MVARVNSAEGGTNGQAVTTANSGGTSGDAWDGLGVPAGASLTFATAAAYKGSQGYRFTHPSGTSWGAFVRWQVAGWAQVRARFYRRFTAYPSQSAIIAGLSSGNSYVAEMVLTPAGRLLMVDNADAVLWQSSSALPLNSWIRFEWIAAPGTNRHDGTLRLGYGLADAALSESGASTTANTGTAGGFDNLYLGKLSGSWATTDDVDDIAADDASSAVFLGVSGSGAVVVDPTPAPEPIRSTFPPPAPYAEAIRSSLDWWVTVDASYRGAPVAGATGLRPTGGSITDTSKPGVRRTLSLELAPEPGLYDLLRPLGTQLTVVAHVKYLDQTVVDIPMGVFDVDSSRIAEAGGALSLTAPDKWVKIQRARFVIPGVTTPGMRVVDQIAQTIKDALGQDEPVVITASSLTTVGALTWEQDRDKAILEMAQSIGAWVYFDRYGVATIADIPTTGADATFWPIDAADDGVLIDVDREQTRSGVYNVVVVSSSASDGEKFAPQFVWDDDPSSPTYAGTDPRFAIDVGPFGIATTYFDSPILNTIGEARNAGLTILMRSIGLSSSVSLESVPNPAIDAYDVLEVSTPPETWGGTGRSERHVVDTVTHPLTVGSAQRIDGRSTRPDDVTGGF